MRSNDHIDWPLYSLLLSFHDLRSLCDDYYPLFLVVWSLAAYHDGRHRRTMIACDAWRLTVKARTSGEDIDLLSHICALLYAPCMIWQAFSCSICFQRPGLASPDSPSTPSSHIHIEQNWQDKWLGVEFNLSKKTYGFVFHSIASLVMAESACASRIFISVTDVPSLVCVWIGIWTGPLLPAFFHSSTCWWMVFTWCCWREFCFCRSWFPCRIQQLFSPVFQWVAAGVFFTASQQIDVVGKPQVTERSSSDWQRRQWYVRSFASSIASNAQQSFSDGCWGVKGLCVIFSWKSTGDDGHPCRTPNVVRKKSPTLQFSNGALVASSYNEQPDDFNQPVVDVVFF